MTHLHLPATYSGFSKLEWNECPKQVVLTDITQAKWQWQAKTSMEMSMTGVSQITPWFGTSSNSHDITWVSCIGHSPMGKLINQQHFCVGTPSAIQYRWVSWVWQRGCQAIMEAYGLTYPWRSFPLLWVTGWFHESMLAPMPRSQAISMYHYLLVGCLSSLNVFQCIETLKCGMHLPLMMQQEMGSMRGLIEMRGKALCRAIAS